MPYRWVVADEAERLAITLNPNGTQFTVDNGLYCKCLQTDDGSEYVLSSISPVEWISIASSSSLASSRKEIFTIHAPAQYTDFPFQVSGGSFTNLFARRLAPNIVLAFSDYNLCLWDIIESAADGSTINVWKANQFATYSELITFLNSNLTGTGSITNNVTVTAYIQQNEVVKPFRRSYGINRFFSVLKGQDNYKSTNYGAKTIDTQKNRWEELPEFYEQVYQDFLGVSAPPADNAGRTFWFPQTIRRMYDHHQNNIQFPSGNASQRRYYLTTNSTTYSGVNGGDWVYHQQIFYGMSPGNTNVVNLSNVQKDNFTCGVYSTVRVSMYLSSSDSNKIAFFIKPVGVDMFHLGFNPAMKSVGALTLFAEYRHPNGYTRLHKIKTISMHNSARNYGMNTSVTVTNDEYINQLIPDVRRTHIRTDTVVGTLRFLAIDEHGQSFQASRAVTVKQGRGHVNSFVLLN